MKLADAKVILSSILEKQVVDSMLIVYEKRDKINSSTITLQVDKIRLLQQKCNNQYAMVVNLNKIVLNKDNEIILKDDIIKQQKKEITKQKVLKIFGFISAVVLPIVVLILMSK